MRVGGQRHAPADLPPGTTRYPLYRRLGRPQGQSGQVRKILPPPGLLGWKSIKFNVGRSSCCKQRECAFDNAVIKSLRKELVCFERYVTVFDVAILRKLAGGVYLKQYNISLYIPIGFIWYQVRFYVPKLNSAWNEFHLSSSFFTMVVGIWCSWIRAS
jgi:hypothetical protein